jgi:hypothetical protein
VLSHSSKVTWKGSLPWGGLGKILKTALKGCAVGTVVVVVVVVVVTATNVGTGGSVATLGADCRCC